MKIQTYSVLKHIDSLETRETAILDELENARWLAALPKLGGANYSIKVSLARRTTYWITQDIIQAAQRGDGLKLVNGKRVP
jgi:hypothetical protein